MLVELCVGDYATYDGHVNGVDNVSKASTTYCDIWMMFQNSKMGTLIKEKYSHY
jgi:hypothetical protein